MINQKDNNAILQQQIQASYALLQQNLLAPESVKSMSIKDISKISKHDDS